jgi:hypothetical protein
VSIIITLLQFMKAFPVIEARNERCNTAYETCAQNSSDESVSKTNSVLYSKSARVVSKIRAKEASKTSNYGQVYK